MPIILVHADAPLMPLAGDACNGCGVCCLVEPCPLGRGVCPRSTGAWRALRWNRPARRYQCGLFSRPREVPPRHPAWTAALVRRLAQRWIAAGSGCDCDCDADRGTGPVRTAIG